MAELVKLTIDGREVQAEKGALLIEVATPFPICSRTASSTTGSQ